MTSTDQLGCVTELETVGRSHRSSVFNQLVSVGRLPRDCIAASWRAGNFDADRAKITTLNSITATFKSLKKKLITTNLQFPIANSQFPIPCLANSLFGQLPIANSLFGQLPIPNSQFPVWPIPCLANSLFGQFPVWPIANSQFPIPNS